MDSDRSGPAMDPERGTLAARRAAFIARITAAATHEFRNILAIVKESSGLVDDLVAAAGSGAPDQQKVRWALDRIRLQVTRGSDLSTSLNRVMHGLDRDEEVVALSEAVRHAGLLAQRFARQQRREIRLEAGEADATVTLNALDLYRGLVAVLEWCVDHVVEGGTVVVEPAEWETRPAVRFRAETGGAGFGSGPESEELLRVAVADLPAEVRWDSGQPLLLVFDGLAVG
jgi:C4-dicarboxylate-specific signal transduction histidine kinase